MTADVTCPPKTRTIDTIGTCCIVDVLGEIGGDAKFGELSLVPKHTSLKSGLYAGVPVNPLSHAVKNFADPAKISRTSARRTLSAL